MPPRKRSAQAGPPAMAQLRETLWRAADKLRGSMDASHYKDFVLGLVFLKYVSDAFAERRERIWQEALTADVAPDQAEALLDDPAEYRGRGVFWVPEQARWERVAASARGTDIGQVLDAAMDAVMRENPSLAGVLPRVFDSGTVDQRRLGELVDLLGSARFSGSARDVLGEVYEYFLERFARSEGRRGGEFYTPASVVRLLVEVLEPYEGRVYDPCCGSGGMFVQAEKFVVAHRGAAHRDDIAVYGQESNERTWRLARMNLALHGIGADLGDRWGDTLHRDRHPELVADFILANPPFNMSDWARSADDPRWRFGIPPAGNANFAWMQHIVARLGPRGNAGVVMANGSMSSRQAGEGEIRAALVEADLVACMIALPPQLFRTTQIPACVWFFAQDKGAGDRGLGDRRGETLFIDARELGTMVDRTERVLTDDDLTRIADTFHAWRGTASAREKNLVYGDVAGFCHSATTDEIRAQGHILAPGRYVGAAEAGTVDDEPIADRVERLTAELFAHFAESARMEREVRAQLGRLDIGGP